MPTVDTGGGGAVGGDVSTGNDFIGRDNNDPRAVFNNYTEKAQSQPPTESQTIYELNRKVDEILDYIRGNVERDIVGIRPRIRQIEQRIHWMLIVQGLFLLGLIWLAFRTWL